MPGQRTGEGPPAETPAQAAERADVAVPVPIDRLLSVAVLTPAQAVMVAVRVLDAADTTQTTDLPAGAVATLGEVSLTPSGDVDVATPGEDGGTPVSALLGQLVHNARRLPAHPRPDQVLLLRRLEEAAEASVPEPRLRARDLEASLADTLGPGAADRLRGQLAALVQAFAHVATSLPVAAVADHWSGPPGAASTTTGTGAPPAAREPRATGHSRRRPGPARPATKRQPRRQGVLLHRRPRGRRVGVVALVLVAALAASGYVALRGPGAALVESLGPDRQPETPAKAAPSRTPEEPVTQTLPSRRRVVATLADRHAGRITGVALQKTGSCTPGGACEVKVTVRLRPSTTAQPVGWKVGAARLCKPGVTWSAPTTVTAQAGWSTVYAHTTMRVPRGRSLELVALTTSPARAQSRPVPVTGSSSRC